jgi:hypothetical protein
VIAEQLAVATQREAPHALLSPPRCADGDPLLDPLCERDLVGCDMRAVVGALEELAQLLASVGQRAMKRLRKALAVDAVAQAPGIFPAPIYTAVARSRRLIISFSAHVDNDGPMTGRPRICPFISIPRAESLLTATS